MCFNKPKWCTQGYNLFTIGSIPWLPYVLLTFILTWSTDTMITSAEIYIFICVLGQATREERANYKKADKNLRRIWYKYEEGVYNIMETLNQMGIHYVAGNIPQDAHTGIDLDKYQKEEWYL